MLRVRKLKSLLLVSCFGAHMASATDTEQSHVDIRVLQSDIETSSERVRKTREAYGDASSIIFIGHIGRGKSTLITHLAGKHLMAQRDDDGITLRSDDPLPGFVVTSGVVGTAMPSAWRDPASGIVYWDCPGFGDPRGPSQDVVNAFSIQQLFQTPSRVKIVLVVTEEDLKGRKESLGKLLDQLVNTFPDDDMLKHSVSLVATRRRDIGLTILERICKQADDLFKEPRAKALVRFLADNSATRFSFMPYPQLSDDVNEGLYEGNRLGILASIEHAEYVINPIFRVALSPMSNTCVRILLDKLNSSVAAKLALSQDRVIEKIYDDITKFNGDSGGLREQIRTHYEAIASLESLRSCRAQDREGVLHFAAIYGLEDATQQFIASSINQLHSLGLMLGEASSPFSIDTWFGSLGRIRKELHDLSVVLAAPPIRITKTPLDESFTGPTSCGTVREEEKFKFPNGLKKVMIRDLSASRLLNYTNDDANLRAVPKEVYTIERPGRRMGGAGVSVNGVETLEGRTLEPVAYERRLMDAHVKEGTFDFGRRIVDLNVKRVYQRPDRTLYTKEEPVSSVPVIVEPLADEVNPVSHVSRKVYRCNIPYDGRVIALPNHYGDSIFNYKGELDSPSFTQLNEDFKRGDFTHAIFYPDNKLQRRVISGEKIYKNIFDFWRKSISLNVNLILLDLDYCFLDNIDPLIEVLTSLPSLEILKTHRVHDSDGVNVHDDDVERPRTRRLAAAIGKLQHLHTLHFDMAYAASNLRSATRYGAVGGKYLGTAASFVAAPIAIAALPAAAFAAGAGAAGAGAAAGAAGAGAAGAGAAAAVVAADVAVGAAIVGGACVPGAAIGGLAAAAVPNSKKPWYERLRRGVVSVVTVPGKVVGGAVGAVAGLAADGIQAATGNSEPEALEIINNLAKARSLRTLNLWKVTSSVFDYDKDNFTKILKEKLPEISITFREDD